MTPNKNILGLRIQDFFEEDKVKAKEYECVFCKKIFSNNFGLECNHCICEICINKYENCPIDGTDIINDINAFNNNFIGKVLLGKLKVNCIFIKNGCNWYGKFDEFYSSHLNQCKFKINNNNKKDNENMEDLKDDYNFENKNMLNKKRKISYEEIKQNREEIINNNNINLSKSNYSIFHQNNINNNLNLLPKDDENFFDDNNEDKGIILEKYFFENYINNLTIDSNLTKNIFPYHYYFTEPLDNSFNCQIKVISRVYNKEISFGLTNINIY